MFSKILNKALFAFAGVFVLAGSIGSVQSAPLETGQAGSAVPHVLAGKFDENDRLLPGRPSIKTPTQISIGVTQNGKAFNIREGGVIMITPFSYTRQCEQFSGPTFSNPGILSYDSSGIFKAKALGSTDVKYSKVCSTARQAFKVTINVVSR